MNAARLVSASALALLLLVSTSACAEQHATVEDCVTALTKSGGDAPDLTQSDRQRACERLMTKTPQDEFDKTFLPK